MHHRIRRDYLPSLIFFETLDSIVSIFNGSAAANNIASISLSPVLILDGKFKSSNRVVLEEFLKGEELSYFAVVDKNSYCFFGSAQDHKRVGEGDVGSNTGGMGAYSPAPILTKELEDKN